MYYFHKKTDEMYVHVINNINKMIQISFQYVIYLEHGAHNVRQ